MAGGQAQLLAIQVLLIFMRFPLPNFNATDLKFGSSTYFFPALFIPSIHKVPSIKFKGR